MRLFTYILVCLLSVSYLKAEPYLSIVDGSKTFLSFGNRCGNFILKDSTGFISKENKQNNWVWTRALPLGLMAYSLKSMDQPAYAMRQHFAPNGRTKIDDYSIFVPMLAWGLYFAGEKPAYSRNAWDMLLTQSSAVAISSIITISGKHLIGRERPDHINKQSFPSGHTSLSFVMSTILAEEYGERYPWLAALGYTSASLTALTRVYNNRHWMSDLSVGAFIGIASTKLAYSLVAYFQRRTADYQPFPKDLDPYQGFHVGFLRSISNVYKPKAMWENESCTANAQLLGMDVRIPFYKRFGLRLLGQLIERERTDGGRLFGFDVFGGISYLRELNFISPLLYADASISLGYLSQTRRTPAEDPDLARSESTPTTAPGAALKPEIALLARTGRHSNLRAYAAYIFSPTAQDYSRLSRDGISGWELGLGVEWAW